MHDALSHYGHREKTVSKSDQNCGFWTQICILVHNGTGPFTKVTCGHENYQKPLITLLDGAST